MKKNNLNSAIFIITLIIISISIFSCEKSEKLRPQSMDSNVWDIYRNQERSGKLDSVFLVTVGDRDYILKKKAPGHISVIKFYCNK